MNLFRTLTTSATRRLAADDFIHKNGRSIGTGLALAGVSAAVASRFMMSEANAESPAGATTINGKSTPANVNGVAPRKIFPGGPALVRLPLESSEVVNHNTKRLRFKLPSEDAISGLPLTSALLTFAWPKGCATPVLRPYTPVTSSSEPGHIDFIVKKYPNGKQSTHLHSLNPGDTVLFAVAIPGYAWTPNKHDSLTLVAGGAGITPIYQLVQGIFEDADKNDKTKVSVIVGVNGNEDVLLRDEFAAYEEQFPDRFRITYTVSHPIPKSPYRKGYVTKELLQEVAAGSADDKNTKVMVCGPPAMEAALLGQKGWFGSAGKSGILGELKTDFPAVLMLLLDMPCPALPVLRDLVLGVALASVQACY